MTDLTFDHTSEYNGGSRWPYDHVITATHPERGEVGQVKYWTSGDRSNAKIKINELRVHPDHRRQGFGSALMDELQRQHPKSSIDHGDRTDMGKEWWKSYGQGRADRRGRTAAREETCDRCHGSGEHPAADIVPSFANVPCPGCKGSGTQRKADWAPTELPEHQQAARAIPDWPESQRALLGIAKDRMPGTKVWRGEVRHVDHLDSPPSVGLHWTADADQIVTPADEPPPTHRRVIWEAQIDHPDQAFPRSHPIWSGKHRSVDHEAEVRFKPGTQVRLTRAYVHDNSSGNTTFVPTKHGRSDEAWQARDMNQHAEIRHGKGGVSDYTDVGIHHEALGPGIHSAQARVTPTAKTHGTTTRAAILRLAFMPTRRLFGPTYGLDHRLFDGEHLKPDVTRYIMETLADFWKPTHGVGWDEWAQVYLAGSEASEWTSAELEGNGDFDVLIGIDYDKFRGHQSRTSAFQTMTDEEITQHFNAELKRLNAKTADAFIMVDGKLTGPWDNTWYVNQNSYDIRRIKPYAAYNVTRDEWAVKPPHLPAWDVSLFPEGPALVAECKAVSAYVRAILAMPEPYRTQQGYALWHHLHSDRARAFSDQGEGWYDPANIIEKWLDQEGLWEKLVQIMVRVKNDPTVMNAPPDWSNLPPARV